MSKVIGVSGAQGSGKTTLLEALRQDGLQVDDFKVSRSVQAALGWKSLSEVMSDPETMVLFQEEIFRQKRARETRLRQEEGPSVLTERTFADVDAYATLWAWEFVEARKWSVDAAIDWLSDFSKRCRLAQAECYAGVVLLPYMPHVEWQTDESRASRWSITPIWESIHRFMCTPDLHELPRFEITAHSVADRAAQVKSFMEQL